MVASKVLAFLSSSVTTTNNQYLRQIISYRFSSSTMAETVDEDDDLKLVTASANLLDNLEASLPKLLWKPSKTDATHGRVHRVVKRRDLDYVIKLVRQSNDLRGRTSLMASDRSSHFKASLNCLTPG